MKDLFVFAAHNTVAALALAFLVLGLTRVWRNPPVAHVLWVLVLLKLVAPPIMRVDWAVPQRLESTAADGPIVALVPQIDGPTAERQAELVDLPAARTTAALAAARVSEHHLAASVWAGWNRARFVCFWMWLGGAAVCALVAATRIVRFERLLQDTLPASERLQRLAVEIAGKLGVRRAPRVCYIEGAPVPFLWCAGRRATIVLPRRLFDELDDQSSGLILAHELAHLRRGDHWVRALELMVATFYWWNPLVLLIRRQIHQSEDLCCDAWVRSLFPDARKRYAEVMLRTAESLDASQRGARLLPPSPFLGSLSLKARIEMILESRFAPRLSARSMFVIALVAFLVLPWFVQTRQAEAWADSSAEASATTAREPEVRAESEFPYAVRFEQGATRFLDGDKITILEVRGTADTFAPGNLYWIKGSYTLASHDRAALAAYVTARDAADGTGTSLKVQSTVVNRGDGTFTLFLPMAYRGWPHVSFYPAEAGVVFGGNYFGTGDSVLKRWWGSPETDRPATEVRAGSHGVATAKPEAETVHEFPHVVRFEQGATRFLNGDKITILEVRGTADTFAPKNTYQIKGTYTLASRDRATLAAYITAADAADGTGSSLKAQMTVVNRGDGAFTLVLPMSSRGWPHVSFYPAEGGECFGGNYVGTGDSVLKKWWES
jgi:beta-lactamase regulating signal transducer with metallopeptidase domain